MGEKEDERAAHHGHRAEQVLDGVGVGFESAATERQVPSQKKIRTKVAKLSSKLRDLQRKDRELENRENLENLLPSELWSLVADKLGDEDLLSLGMSCRYFRGVWREERKVRELPIPELSILIEL